MIFYKIFYLMILGIAGNIDLSQQSSFQTKCLEKYGCFYNGPPFYHPLLRPTTALPFDLKDFHTKFYLYTSPKEHVTFEPTKVSLERSGYNKSLGLRVFIHGFQVQFDAEILARVEEFIGGVMKAEPTNMVVVDWTATNREPWPQAIANGRVVGAQVAELIEFIMNSTGLESKDVHVIGASLGAHVSGWAGERLKNLGRITGLDPAGPYFQYTPPEVRLDTSDATFVDIIHSGAADFILQGLGILEPIGHLDFYPNGGRNQPGCEQQSPKITFADMDLTTIGKNINMTNFNLITCDHGRAISYFLESAESADCKFIGYECPDYEKFQWNRCKSNTKAEMGLFAKKDESVAPGSKFFLITENSKPFCIRE